MSIILLASAVGLGAAAYIYSSSQMSYEDAVKSQSRPGALPGYNPYILNQYQTMRDVIYSADLAENNIHAKPSHVTDGVYGISEHHIKLSPFNPFTVVSQKTNLNR